MTSRASTSASCCDAARRGAALERLAPELIRDLGTGATGRRQRGLLVVYDARSGKGRIEVGPGLEEYFPDGLVGYLLRNHVETLFASGNPTQGIHLLLRMLHHRIRQALLDERFDPRVLDVLEDRGHLSRGAVATATLPLGAPGQKIAHPRVNAPERAQLGPQPSPEAAYRAYLAWLSLGRFDRRSSSSRPRPAATSPGYRSRPAISPRSCCTSSASNTGSSPGAISPSSPSRRRRS
jgi:hypothetical protein